jgi:uncharacterized repeat protein (TIGR03803 family)
MNLRPNSFRARTVTYMALLTRAAAGRPARMGGTVFKVTPSGTLTTLYRFCSLQNCTDGGNPLAGLLLGTDGNFYGTTWDGGTFGWGTVFKITTQGTLTTLHSFAGYANDGGLPAAPLIQATDGNFYGTTSEGGDGTTCSLGCGTVFKMTPQGTITILQNLNGISGAFPMSALIQATDGNLYGTTAEGGANTFCYYGCGTVFKMALSGGTLTTLHSFDGDDGAHPAGALVQARNGSFYGTTFQGALSSNLCNPDGNFTCGTVFKISAGGALTTLYRFDGADGGDPSATLIQATDGSLYGTTSAGGSDDAGTIFTITSQRNILYTFWSFDGLDGALPYGALMQATNGTLYGVAAFGGNDETSCDDGCGTIFSENVGLSPFVIAVPSARKVGQKVIILGTNLTGATSVAFNGTAATFTVVSATEIGTTVPANATTGTVQVVTTGGTLSSNVPFRVSP